MVDLALKTLLHDRTRFAITVAGVAFAVLLVLFQVGLFLGLLDNASVTIEHIDAELWVTSKNTPNVDFSHAFPESRVERVRSIHGVERADNLITTYILVKVAPGADAGAVASEIRRRLPYNDVHTRAAWASKSRSYWVTNTGLGFNLFITVFLGCLVGIVVVAQTLYTSTMEHLKE